MNPAILSVVLPCYNESGNLPRILSGYAEVAAKVPMELILVNNGSTDDSAAVLSGLLSRPEHNFARVVTVAKNIGYGHGIKSGLAQCRTEAVGYSHADMQCPPEDVLRAYLLFQEMGKKPDLLVKGLRLGRVGSEAFVSLVYKKLSGLVLGRDLGDVNGQPKIFHRSLVHHLLDGPDDFSFDLYALYQAARLGVRREEFPVRFDARQHGESKWASNRLSKARTILKSIVRIFQIRLGKRWPTVS